MRHFFYCIVFFVAFTATPTFSQQNCDADGDSIGDGCKKCKGNTYVGCRHGTTQEAMPCTSCRQAGCGVSCASGSSSSSGGSSQPASSASSSSSGSGKNCTTGNKGESVVHGCTYCMSDSETMACNNGAWSPPKKCSPGQKCYGGLSSKLKVACDGKCSSSSPQPVSSSQPVKSASSSGSAPVSGSRPPSSASVGGGKPCATGNKGDTVPHGCKQCMSDTLCVDCVDGVFKTSNCPSGKKCKGGLSHNLKPGCDGRCE